MRFSFLVVALIATSGCGAFRYVEFPNDSPIDHAGNTTTLRYLSYPGHGARGVARTPTVRWNRDLLIKDLGTPTRVILQIATEDGALVWRASGDTAGASTGWLVDAQALRVFSVPPGALIEADPTHADRGRLAGSHSYRLSLYAENAKGLRVFEAVGFETEEAALAPAEVPSAKAP